MAPTVHRRDTYMTLRILGTAIGITAALAACRDESRIAPAPTSYAWPDSFAFKMEYVAETRTDSAVVVRYEERKELRFLVRDDQFLVWHDSVLKESLLPGGRGEVEPYAIEDTLPYYLSLDRRGRVSRSEPGCDPALPLCRRAMPSALPLELARLIPRLPVWPAPRGSVWADTLSFDDTRRPGGQRGAVVTQYRVAADTVVAGVALWKVGWHSERRSYTPAPGGLALVAGAPVGEDGYVFIDKEREVPVFAMWAGAAAAPADLAALGVRVTAFRGRAYLAGSVVERLLGPPQ